MKLRNYLITLARTNILNINKLKKYFISDIYLIAFRNTFSKGSFDSFI